MLRPKLLLGAPRSEVRGPLVTGKGKLLPVGPAQQRREQVLDYLANLTPLQLETLVESVRRGCERAGEDGQVSLTLLPPSSSLSSTVSTIPLCSKSSRSSSFASPVSLRLLVRPLARRLLLRLPSSPRPHPTSARPPLPRAKVLDAGLQPSRP